MIKRLIAPVCAAAVLGAAALVPSLPTPVHAATALQGAGSSFDFPFFDSAFKAYANKHSVTVNYQPVGSGAGIQNFIQKLVDFGASDVPLNPVKEEPAAVKAGGPVQQIPIALGGVSVAFNIPGVKNGALKLDGPTLARIYLGTITKWNDPAIKKLNKNLKLPDLTITVVHRADSSGTSYAFTDYLSKVSDQWRGLVGVGKTPNWPTGVGGQANLGVAQLVQQTSGAIGYVELAYVIQNHMKQAAIKNRNGFYQTPSPKTVAADAAAFPSVSFTNFSIANGKGKQAYPICTYSWVILFRNQPDTVKGKALVALMTWMVTTAQTKYAKPLDYVPLPASIQKVGLKLLKQVK
jgi:phosphate transport system substrate-binding protein